MFRFDPTGKLLILDTALSDQQQVRLEMPSGRFLGPVPVIANGPGSVPVLVNGVSPGARLFAVQDDEGNLCLHNGAGSRLIERLSESVDFLTVSFSPDLDGRFMLWGNPSGSVSVADLVEVQRRLAEIELGW